VIEEIKGKGESQKKKKNSNFGERENHQMGDI